MKKYRKPIRLERLKSPSNMEKTCFVSGSDANYFPLLIELIASIRMTRFYKDIPFYVLDGGLSDSQKRVLHQNKISVVRHDVVLDITSFVTLTAVLDDPPLHLIGVVNKGFLPEIIPDYEYYFWINPNMWVQDERALDEYMTLAERQTIAHSHSVQQDISMHVLGDMSPKYISHIPSDLFEECKDRLHGSDAVFCAHKSFFDEASSLLREYTQDGRFFYYVFELIQTLYMKRHNLDEYVDTKWYAHTNHTEQLEGFYPVWRTDQDQTLYTTYDLEHPIGIVRPIGKKHFQDIIKIFDVNLQEIVGSVRGSTRFFLK